MSWKQVVDDSIESQPMVSENVVADEIDKAPRFSPGDNGGASAQDTGPTDSYGRSFDPDLHKTKEGGEPLLTLRGRLRVKKGKKPKSDDKSTVGTLSSKIEQHEANYKAMGKMATGMMIQGGAAVFGPEYLPRPKSEVGYDERLLLEGAFEEFFRAKEIKDLPPGLALVVAIGAYSLPRKCVQEKLQGAVAKTSKISLNKIFGKFGKSS